MDDYSSWIGRTEIVTDDISPATAHAAAATFEEDPERVAAGEELPHLWHWFYFLPKASQRRLDNDGHPRRETGTFFPPIPYPRRMFAGARVRWHRPLRIGHPARREAVIRGIVNKSGRSGQLAFVTVTYEITQDDVVCIEEQQDIVYREPGPPLAPPKAVELPSPPEGSWSQTVIPNTLLLFRFSALTFNAHRIHYDRPYAIKEEGYPGLVVHGPLAAMLLLQLVREHTAQSVVSFSFRSQAPLFDLASFRLVGARSDDRVELQAQGPNGKAAVIATAELEKQ